MASCYIGVYYYLSLMDSAVAADKANIKSFTARLKCFLGKCSRCLLLMPETGATPSDLGLGPYFFASYSKNNLKNSFSLSSSRRQPVQIERSAFGCQGLLFVSSSFFWTLWWPMLFGGFFSICKRVKVDVIFFTHGYTLIKVGGRTLDSL